MSGYSLYCSSQPHFITGIAKNQGIAELCLGEEAGLLAAHGDMRIDRVSGAAECQGDLPCKSNQRSCQPE